jgi:hypothetical protein
MCHHVAVRRDEEDLQPDIQAGLASAEGQQGQQVERNVSTGAAHLPAVYLTAHRDRLDDAFERTRPAHGDTPDLGERHGPFSRRAPLPYSLKMKEW